MADTLVKGRPSVEIRPSCTLNTSIYVRSAVRLSQRERRLLGATVVPVRGVHRHPGLGLAVAAAVPRPGVGPGRGAPAHPRRPQARVLLHHAQGAQGPRLVVADRHQMHGSARPRQPRPSQAKPRCVYRAYRPQVLRRGMVEWSTPSGLERGQRTKKMLSLRPITAEDLFPGTYGQRLYKPLLGRCYELPSKAIGCTPTIALETDLPKVQAE